MHGVLAGLCIFKIGFCLCYHVAVFHVFDDHQCVTFGYLGVFVKTDLFDESLYT